MDSYTSVREWNSSFLDASFKTLRDTLNKKGKENIEKLIEERREIYKAYNSMEGFPEKFKEYYGINLKSFFEIRFELMLMCYYNVHTVGVWKKSKLFSELKKKTGYPEAIINKAIELSGNSEYQSVINVGDLVMTNFRRLSVSRRSLLQGCFNEYYENDLKGKTFEEACRKLLRDNKFNTLSTCIDVFEPMLPLGISEKFWRKQKQRTDLDVIANRKNQILVIECKEIKFDVPKIREKNQFIKYVLEQVYRTKWISENFNKFKKYLKDSGLKELNIQLGQTLYFFPIVVTNRLVNIPERDKVPLITYSELKELVAKKWEIDSEDEIAQSTIEIGGKTFGFPCFITKNGK